MYLSSSKSCSSKPFGLFVETEVTGEPLVEGIPAHFVQPEEYLLHCHGKSSVSMYSVVVAFSMCARVVGEC